MYQDKFSETELTAIKLIVLTDEYRQLRGENTDYYMIAYVKERVAGTDYDLGNTYLQASWEAESDKPQLVDRYRALAIEKLDAFVKRNPNRSKEWWTASVLAAELDRLLGNFDAVETRFKSLPLAELNDRFSDTGLMGALDQIRMHALSHNSKPEEMRPQAVGERAAAACVANLVAVLLAGSANYGRSNAHCHATMKVVVERIDSGGAQ